MLVPSIDEFFRELEGKDLPPFRPYVDKRHNALNVFFKPDAYYAKSLTDEITLYLATDTNEVVGCRVALTVETNNGLDSVQAGLPSSFDYPGTN